MRLQVNKLTIDDIVAVAQQIHHQKGKYIKSTLSSLESLQNNERLNHETRKIVLDNFNDFARSILEALGYRVEL